jgi:hypothetical protein
LIINRLVHTHGLVVVDHDLEGSSAIVVCVEGLRHSLVSVSVGLGVGVGVFSSALFDWNVKSTLFFLIVIHAARLVGHDISPKRFCG